MDKALFLSGLRRRLGVTVNDRTRLASVASRLERCEQNTIPAAAKCQGPALVDLFSRQISRVGATVEALDDIGAVPGAVARYFDGKEIEVCLSNEVAGLGLDFTGAKAIRITSWQEKTSLDASITHCYAAVAESGSLVIRSGKTSPLSLNFLAEHHIAIVQAKDMVGYFELLWARVREDGGLPRDLTLVSGPSCTGDIEMIMENGAHGPRALHVLVIGQAEP